MNDESNPEPTVEVGSVIAEDTSESTLTSPEVEAAPVEAAPVEAAPVEAAPVEAAPVEAAPVEAAPVEAAPGIELPVLTESPHKVWNERAQKWVDPTTGE